MDLGLKGKKAVITGASRGIGFCIADQLASEGVDIAFCGITQKNLDIAKAKLEQHGTKVFAKALDASNLDELGTWVHESATALGGIDLVVSNTSAMVVHGEAGWKTNIDIDLMPYIRLAETSLPYLEKSDAPSILALGSIASVETFANPASAYGAIKAAMMHHTSGLAQNLAKQGIRVNMVSPGPVWVDGGQWDQIQERMPEYVAQIIANVPRGTMGTPEEISNAAVFLLSPLASFITGINLVVDGGYTKKVKY